MATKRQTPTPSVPDDHDSVIATPVSIRLHAQQITWVTKQGAASGLSLGGGIRELIEDARTYFGLPSDADALLEADRVGRGQDRREYMANLLNRRYTELVIAKAQADAKEKTPPSK
jgi:hypothetical protein